MTTRALFPTFVYTSRLATTPARSLGARLRQECEQLRKDDKAGRSWSRDHYAGGYTSYGSANRMHQVSPTFAALERALARHVGAFTRTLDYDLRGRKLAMTDCWVNIMPRGVVHGLHLHPLSTLSGTYYVQIPEGSPGIKLEDPRLDRMMAAPPRKARSRAPNRPWVVVSVSAGTLVLFESWLRHEVPANPVREERISISFNYSWF